MPDFKSPSKPFQHDGSLSAAWFVQDVRSPLKHGSHGQDRTHTALLDTLGDRVSHLESPGRRSIGSTRP